MVRPHQGIECFVHLWSPVDAGKKSTKFDAEVVGRLMVEMIPCQWLT